ncbi:hypothetical protein H6G88_09855 [Bifidobacterium ruminantium]|uniref:hypothetical protein n=1 Tax=Bifidobacterium ruminantium TaxID=78346 RepID=UPI00195C75BD|nr:hypothetical protein [Bifidobacterium ruminantium]MBM6747574.1 hypothetical protein [Bifidobacterium ruminantium]
MEHEHHSMDAGEFKARYGVTPQEVQDALDENRYRVTKRLSEWGYAWAVDEILCDVTVELLKGGLRRWASYTDRRPLAAFVNALVGNRLGEWMRMERPKYRTGMTHAPRKAKRTREPTQGEPLDADTVRRRLRQDEHDAALGRLCEEADVFGDPDSNVLSAPAGDRSSYQEWLTGGDQPAELASDAYKSDLKYLKNECEKLGGKPVWTALLRQCLVTRDGSALRNEVRRFLENSHRGLDPKIDNYPYILAAIGRRKARKTR